MWETTGFDEMMYNITEDQRIKDYFPYSNEGPVLSSTDLMLDLLTSPLPADLPAGNKNLLLITAALLRQHRSICTSTSTQNDRG
jgi:hypothetical protein